MTADIATGDVGLFLTQLMKYNINEGDIKGSIFQKAKVFNRQKCVVKIKEGIYEVLPIKGYNKTKYTCNVLGKICNCQYQVKTGQVCSHLVAAMLNNYQGR